MIIGPFTTNPRLPSQYLGGIVPGGKKLLAFTGG